MEINDLDFIKVNEVSPEAYDVFDKEQNKIAYVQLRWGILRCLTSKSVGNMIYEFVLPDKTNGEFLNEEQRSKYLNIVSNKIKEYGISMQKI